MGTKYKVFIKTDTNKDATIYSSASRSDAEFMAKYAASDLAKDKRLLCKYLNRPVGYPEDVEWCTMSVYGGKPGIDKWITWTDSHGRPAERLVETIRHGELCTETIT